MEFPIELRQNQIEIASKHIVRFKCLKQESTNCGILQHKQFCLTGGFMYACAIIL